MTQKRSWPSGSPSATSTRSAPSTRAATGAWSATIRIASPGLAPSAAVARSISASDRNLAIGERHPESSTTAHARPLAPRDCARSVRESKRLRGHSPPVLMARTTPPAAMAPEKTLNSDPRKTSVRSEISVPSRRSGRSEP